MSKSNNHLLPLSVLTLSTVGLIVAPACFEAPEYDDSIPRSIEELKVDMCPAEYLEADAEGTMQFVCGVVVDSEGNPIEDGVVIRIDGKVVSDNHKVDWQRERSKDDPVVSIDISAPGYVPFAETTRASLINQAFVLTPVFEQELNWEEGGEIVDPSSGSIVAIPPGSLQTLDGTEPEGAVRFGTFFFNPALQELPGDLSALDANNNRVFLQSFGTLFMSARDEAGNELELAPGAQVQVTMPIDERVAESDQGFPESTALWTFNRERAIWEQVEGEGVVFQANSLAAGHESLLHAPSLGNAGPNDLHAPIVDHGFDIWDCASFSTSDPCIPEHCKYNSTTGTTGAFGSLGFVNFDIAMTNPACIHVDIDESALSPEDFPVCLRFTIAGPAGPIVHEECMGPDGTVLFNIPAHTDAEIDLLYTYGCPAPGHTTKIVNSGAPWGGSWTPSSPSLCNGGITLPPF